MKQTYFILLSLLVTVISIHGVTHAEAGEDTSSFTLLYSNNVAGEFEPCG